MHADMEKLSVTVITGRFQIDAEVFCYPGAQLLDVINIKEEFVPLMDVSVRRLADGQLVKKSDFMALNRKSIILIFSREEDGGPSGGPDQSA